MGARPQLVSFQDQLLESPAQLSEMFGAGMQAGDWPACLLRQVERREGRVCMRSATEQLLMF